MNHMHFGMLLGAVLSTFSLAPASAQGKPLSSVVIYDEAEGTSLFPPSGWMPDGDGMAVQTDCTTNPHTGKTCMKIGFDPSVHSWIGCYFLAGDSWGEKPGVDIFELMGIERGTKIRVSFWSRSDDGAFIECKVGGVNRGRYPDSLPFAKTTHYFKTTKEWSQKSIDLTGQDLSNLVGGFCVVTDKAHNPGKDHVWFYLDDIKVEAQPGFDEKIDSLRWVAYCPTGFDPEAQPPVIPSTESVEQDLQTLRPYFDGIVTFGCSDGLERVPAIARRLGFTGFIQGIWDVHSELELGHVTNLAGRELIDAVVCGNEGLGDRYDLEELIEALRRVRAATGLPVSTSEQIEDYGESALIEHTQFLAPVIHPMWRQITDVGEAVSWLDKQVRALKDKAGGRPLLVKETGMPSGGGTAFSQESQLEFWRGALRVGRETGAAIVAFEAFDTLFKREPFRDGDVGRHWGLFDASRRPKSVIEAFARDKR